MANVHTIGYPMPTFEQPPLYYEAQRSSLLSNTPRTDLEFTHTLNNGLSTTFKSIVIPQTSKSFRGVFFSPFSRAYSPSLSASSIPVEDFMCFIDGLNEAFIAAPAFQIASYLGGAMAMVPFHPVMFAGMGLQLGAGLASAATSFARAKAFVNTANEEMFEPKGLKCKILKTKKMMAAVGHGGEVLSLPPLETAYLAEGVALEGADKDDPRMRRVRALGDLIAPLTFNGLPKPETMDNWWKRMGSKEAQRKDAKMQKRLMKKREEGLKKLEESLREAEEEGMKCDEDIFSIQREQMKEQEKAERKLSGEKGRDPEQRVKVEMDLAREMRKLDREMEKAVREKEKKVRDKTEKGQTEMSKAETKEHEVAQKIYWIVIDRKETLDQEVGEADVESLESK